MAVQTLSLKQQEAKTLVFTIVDTDGDVVDVNTATMTFTVKTSKSAGSYVIQKEDADFDKTAAGSGIVKVTLNETDLDLNPITHYAELKTYFSTTNVDKSDDILLTIEKAVY